MSTQSLTMVLAGATLLAFTSACERPRDETPSAPAAAAPTRTTPGVGEGERETETGTASTPASTPEGTAASTPASTPEGAATAAAEPRAVIDEFQKQIANDPAITAVSNASLIYTVNGEYVLQGTAESRDVKRKLEDAAEKLAGRQVKNEIEVANK